MESSGGRRSSSTGGRPALSTEPWPVVRSDLELLARVAVRLLRDPASWVRRRVTTYSYVADLTVRRQMSIDLVLPDGDSSDSADPMWELTVGTMIWVPLWVPKKAPLTHFDVWDESGDRLTVLNTRENSALAANALGILAAVRIDLSPERRDQLTRIAGSDPAIAADVFEHNQAWLDEAFPSGTSGHALCEDLRDGFMLLVPMQYEPGRPRLIKWTADGTIPWHGHHPSDETRLMRSATWLGLLDKVHSFPDLAIGLSESYHVEVVAPEDVEISDAFLVATQWAPAGTGPGRIQTEIASVAEQHERAHMNVAVRAPHGLTERARGDRGTVVLTLRARRTGAFVGLWLTSLLIALLLLVLRIRLEQIDNTDAVTFLLVFPALVAAYLARPGEHVLAARLLAGVRFVALAGGLSALIAAAMFTTGMLATRLTAVRPPVNRCLAASTDAPATGPELFECTQRASRSRRHGPGDVPLGVLDSLIAFSFLVSGVLLLSLRAGATDDDLRRFWREVLAAPLLREGRLGSRAAAPQPSDP
jgi:hypothetical protein